MTSVQPREASTGDSKVNQKLLEDYFANKNLRSFIKKAHKLVKGEISDEEIDLEIGPQHSSVNGIIDGFSKILLENEKIGRADVDLQIHLTNVKDRSRCKNTDCRGMDERGGRILRR
ncbi:unnamed protein product [Thelazia callipaeda]|uniref:HTH La-type RNA-binding domain-containing protein n=1 Tax=Thelazia callipaeda TaxID=103827 RepID=A0A0N5DC09_THECL|nr:unnamed protein product [Thelazia callipaeda]